MDESKINPDPRRCTCHPDDNPPTPCPRKFALHHCRIAAISARLDQIAHELHLMAHQLERQI